MSALDLPAISFETYLEESVRLEARVDRLLGDFYEKRGHGERHAILDFLVEYYSFRKSKLTTWTPGFGGRVLHQDDEQLRGNFWRRHGSHSEVTDERLGSGKLSGVRWTLHLLKSIDSRPPVFHCHGMHEWAMVYKSSEIRHPHLKLRLTGNEIDRFVESQPIGCSHIDAFRFFTEPARPLNRFQPSRETQAELDQPGCLHVTMDLYKWAYKGWPWVPSTILVDALELAIDARILDMQASPYDVSNYGYEAVAIETVAGRREYAARQEALSHRAEPIRKRLIAYYERLFDQCHLASGDQAGRFEPDEIQTTG